MLNIFGNFKVLGSGALPGKMMLVRIVEDNNIDEFLGHIRLSKG